MIDFTKRSHDRYADTFYQRLTNTPSFQQRDRLFDHANAEEMRGNYELAELLRRAAMGRASLSD